jgi:hypothetical protein
LTDFTLDTFTISEPIAESEESEEITEGGGRNSRASSVSSTSTSRSSRSNVSRRSIVSLRKSNTPTLSPIPWLKDIPPEELRARTASPALDLTDPPDEVDLGPTLLGPRSRDHTGRNDEIGRKKFRMEGEEELEERIRRLEDVEMSSNLGSVDESMVASPTGGLVDELDSGLGKPVMFTGGRGDVEPLVMKKPVGLTHVGETFTETKGGEKGLSERFVSAGPMVTSTSGDKISEELMDSKEIEADKTLEKEVVLADSDRKDKLPEEEEKGKLESKMDVDI